MKEESHRASELCEKSVDKTTHRTKPRRLDGHSLYSAQRPPGPWDFQADHREVRPAARQFRRRRHSPQGGRRSARTRPPRPPRYGFKARNIASAIAWNSSPRKVEGTRTTPACSVFVATAS